MITKEKPSQPELYRGYFIDETNKFIPYRDDLRKAMHKVDVPLDKDKKPDAEAYIKRLLSSSEAVVTGYFGDGRDPQWGLFLDEVASRLRGYANLFKDAKLRETILNAVIEDYVNKTQQYVLSRGVGRGRSLPSLAEHKAYVREVAKGDPALEDLVNDAKTPEDLSTRSPTVHNAVLARKLQGHELTGKVYPWKKTA